MGGYLFNPKNARKLESSTICWDGHWKLDTGNPSFKDGINACCGSRPYGGIFTCGGTKKAKE
ncbi:hypothetical protein JHK85_043381 [Glycine max]|nr:hypothetical protein JHK86_042748 [Glycine max]KAG4957001.1 hypothetical protein JHK85_043381 [Glycine max]